MLTPIIVSFSPDVHATSDQDVSPRGVCRRVREEIDGSAGHFIRPADPPMLRMPAIFD